MKKPNIKNFTVELSRAELLKIRGKGPGDENPGGGPIILPPTPIFGKK